MAGAGEKMKRSTLVGGLANAALLLALLSALSLVAGAALPFRAAALPRLATGIRQETRGLQPEAQGQLSGTVYLDRTAEGTNEPASGALVTLTSSLGTTEIYAQADGSFVQGYPNGHLPLEVTVAASFAGYREAVAVVTVYPGEVTTTTLALELLDPWIEVSPTALDVTVVANSQLTATLVISNNGPADLLVTLIEEIPADTAPAVTAASPATTSVQTPFSVDDAVAEALQMPGATADFFIWMRDRADLSRAPQIPGKEDRRQFVFEALTQTADRAQAAIRRYLEGRGLDYEVFWINNAILVRGGDQAVVEAMRARNDVARIRGVYTRMHVPDPEQLAVVTPEQDSPASNPTWNIEIVNAPQVWDQLGVTGAGTVVANIDTGVRYTHEALVGSYRGNLGNGTYNHNYNWGALDGSAPTACSTAPYAPCDWSGHGTHTMGIMAGGDGDGPLTMDIGMAPGAQWMACLGCDLPSENACSDEALTGCAQWVIAPLDLDGLNPDPALAPDVVNNSWGGEGGDDWYYSFVEAWHAADIIPTFSAGNAGPTCSTLSSPGDYANVLGMAGTDSSDLNYTGSSRGPGLGTGIFPLQKPDLAAPAEGVVSAAGWWDTYYTTLSGTSMAAPHMAGLAALMRSVDPGISFEQVRDIAQATAMTETLDIKNGSWCGTGPAFPNYVFGYGRIDALVAVSETISRAGIPWLSLEPVSGRVAPGTALPVELTFHARGLADGVYTGTLQVHHNDPLTGDVLVPVTMTVVPVPPVLFVTKTANPWAQYAGELVTYTIRFGNEPGAGSAPGVVVTDTLPAEVEFVRAGAGGVYDDVAHEVVWAVDLAGGESIQTNIVGTIGAEVPGGTWLTNTVSLAWDEMAPLVDQVTHYVTPPSEFFVEKSAEPVAQRAGQLVTYTIAFSNARDTGSAVAVKLGDALPPEVEFVSASSGGEYDPGFHEVAWFTELAPAQTMTVTLVGRVGATVAGGTWLTNSARLAWDVGFLDAQASHYVLHGVYLPVVVREE
jgi:uncharacterized repeat protein (TIGR01451 family)